MRCKDCQGEWCRKEFTKVIATIAYDKCVYSGTLLDFWAWCKADRTAVCAEIACRNRFLDLKSVSTQECFMESNKCVDLDFYNKYRGTNWTKTPPTQPGRYWLSIAPDKRNRNDQPLPAVIRCDARERVGKNGYLYYLQGFNWSNSEDHLLDGALWFAESEPSDPFMESK